MDYQRVSPWGVRHSCGSTRSLHCPGSLKRLISSGLNDVLSGWLLGETLFNHTQTSMSEMLRVLSNSPRIGSGTPSGLRFQPWSTVTMSPAVPGLTPNQSGLGLLMCPCAWTCRKVTFISCVWSAGGVNFVNLWSSLKCMSSRGHMVYHSAFLGTKQPRCGKCPITGIFFFLFILFDRRRCLWWSLPVFYLLELGPYPSLPGSPSSLCPGMGECTDDRPSPLSAHLLEVFITPCRFMVGSFYRRVGTCMLWGLAW
jgi:hypothetical protein